MTYAQQFALVSDSGFKGRVMMATLAAARNVLTEPNTVDYAYKRKQLARALIENPEQHISRFVLNVAANSTIAAAGPTASTDTDIDFVVSSVFTEIARLVA